ncbi:Tcb3 protein [Saccharomycopsis crataegensis]|uniref:Tcb3 protein n=1 Tax=Saccharomycopsis crataegensis TaxID=43959 RepID=A0AAV5QX88_9ASCO|nr:Tcb3 protein [Saccharomycopsis crataegensis]
MSSGPDTASDSGGSSKVNKRFTMMNGSSKNVLKAPGKLAGGLTKGASDLNKGIMKGATDLNKGIVKGASDIHNINKGLAKGALDIGKNAIEVGKGVNDVAKLVTGAAGNLLSKSEEEEKLKSVEKPKVIEKPKPKPSHRKLNTDLATFDWESVGYFQTGIDKGGDGEAMLAKSEAMKTYLSDAYYSDLYVNTILVTGTCFFSWLIARVGGSFLWLGLVFLGATSVYRAEFRRFTRDTRDDMLRLSISDRLENETETLEWCNNLLSKVWSIYMPLMGDIVKTNVNPILAGVAPGGGIDSIELTHFHLGSVAPKITGIKSYTKITNDAYEMDWAFAFDPNNRENMTKAEIRKQIMPKVVIKAALGKGIISKKFPINVEDMGFVGRMKIRLTFTDKFPMIELIRVQFLEPPKIDYALKPIGGDTFGIDIMKFIPGLKSIINEGINWGIKSFLIAPNYQEVNLVDIMSAASTDINSVLAVELKDITLSNAGDYYAVLCTENSAEDKKIRTDTKPGTKNPVWNKTYYVLNNSIEQNLLINVYKSGGFGKDKLVGTAEFDLTSCYQKDKFTGLNVKLKSSGKHVGFANFDLFYFPELEAPTLDDGAKGPVPESEVGILKFVLNEAKDLDVSSSLVGQVSPYAEIYFDGKLKHKTRVLKRSNEPSFGDVIETLVSSKSETNIKIVIKDSVGFSEDTMLGEYEGVLGDILSQVESTGNSLFKLSAKGVIKITPTWRPLAMAKIASEVSHKDPLGVFRIHVRDASELHGSVDPYVSISLNDKVRFQTIVHPENSSPIFEEVCYIPVTSENQYVTLDVFDAEKNGRDKILGDTSFKADKLLKKSPSGEYYYVDGSEKIVKAPLFKPKSKTSKGFLSYSISFIPTTAVYSPKELLDLKKEDEKIQEKMEKEKEEQEKLQLEFKKKPKDYEWVEVDSPYGNRDPHKKQIPLSELITHNSGVLSVDIIKGSLDHKKAFLHVLVDEVGYPGLVAGPANAGLVSSSYSTIFIRDLKNSVFVVREASKEEAEAPEDVYYEHCYSTLEILKKAYNEPTTLKIGNGNSQSTVTLQVSYSPSKVELHPSELMIDTGKLTLDILNGEDLLAADSNGKSDPYAVIKLNGAKVFQTEIQKKTLHPTFNESASFPIPSLKRTRLVVQMFDWDLAGDDDYLGDALIDLSQVKPGHQTSVSTPLVLEGKPAGKINFRVGFEPQYIRPKIEKFGGGLPGIGAVSKVPVKLVGGVAKGAVGGVGLIAGGVGKGGGKILGALGGKKSKRYSLHFGHGNSDTQSTINGNESTYDAESSFVSTPTNGAASIIGGANESQLSSTMTSSTAIFGGKRSTGRITIKELHGLDDTHQHLSLRVLLKNNDLGTKEILKTRRSKVHEATYKFSEEATFKAIPEDGLVFEALVPHRLGKDKKIAEGSIAINSVVDNSDDLTVELGNLGNAVINVRYSAPSA